MLSGINNPKQRIQGI